MERSVWVWTLPWERGDRLAIIRRIAGSGATKAYVKAAGDGGVAWIIGERTPGWGRPQWSREWLADFHAAGIATVPWAYVWPGAAGEADKLAISRALDAVPADELMLNPEVEWWYTDSANDFRSLADANAKTIAWVADLRAKIGRPIRLGYSSCPSWAAFPYEGWAQACDFASPQHYWPDRLMARGEDQVEAHVRRAGRDQFCVPTLTACREYDDQGVVDLAVDALADFPQLDGFSAWEAANSAFQAAAMAQAYRLLPTSDPAPAAPDAVAALRDLLTRLAR